MFTRPDRAFAAPGVILCGLAACVCGAACAGSLPAEPAARSSRVLILSGPGGPDWQATTLFLRQVLADTGRFDVRVCEAPHGLTARTLADFDVLVDVSGASAARNDSEGEIARFVAAGKGLVVTNGALAEQKPGTMAPGCWPASVPGDGPRPAVRFLEGKIVPPEHAITQGMPTRFRIADDLPRGLSVHSGAEVLATAGDENSPEGGGADQPLLLAMRHGNGRVFCTVMGHDLAAMHDPAFLATFARGTEWAATGKVTLPPDVGLSRPHVNAVRGLVITGGHDHETSFYRLFDGYRDIAGLPVTTSAAAFQNDLRGKYDVVIMYDFSRDLDETGKQNLRDFVTSGKGVVVLHHALLNYQNWTWWTHEAVGGSYRLSNEGDVPSSTVKDNQQFFVTPERRAADHRGGRALPHRRRGLQANVVFARGSAPADHRQPQQRPGPGMDRSERRVPGGRDPARPRSFGIRSSRIPGPGSQCHPVGGGTDSLIGATVPGRSGVGDSCYRAYPVMSRKEPR